MTSADVLVVGAGIVGACVADALTARGARVVVVEAAAAPATGSTGRSCAGVRGQWADETNALLAWRSIQAYRADPTSSGYRPCGYLLLVPTAAWDDHLRGVALQQQLGIPVEVLTPAEGQAHLPFVTDGLAGCTFGPADGVVDPDGITSSALRRARSRSGELHLSSPVTAVKQLGDGWRVTAGSSSYDVGTVVNAAGGWSGEVARLAGLDVPVHHVRRALFASAQGAVGEQLPLTIDLDTGVYLRSEGLRVLLGRANPAEPPGYRTDVPWEWLEPTLEAGSARFPWLAELPLDRAAAWAGTYDTSPDHQAILGRMPGADTWVNACGFSGHGVMQAAAVGELIAEEVLDGRAHSTDIDALRIERLARETSDLAMVF